MTENSATKVSTAGAPVGEHGQKHLAHGTGIAMRMWENEMPGEPKPVSRRNYETVGYVLKGRAELHMSGSVVPLEEGDSWVVPEGAEHTYKFIENFTAIEATHPPAV
jgi:quercetin dioxygenase-like cupin family protein